MNFIKISKIFFEKFCTFRLILKNGFYDGLEKLMNASNVFLIFKTVATVFEKLEILFSHLVSNDSKRPKMSFYQNKINMSDFLVAECAECTVCYVKSNKKKEFFVKLFQRKVNNKNWNYCLICSIFIQKLILDLYKLIFIAVMNLKKKSSSAKKGEDIVLFKINKVICFLN